MRGDGLHSRTVLYEVKVGSYGGWGVNKKPYGSSLYPYDDNIS